MCGYIGRQHDDCITDTLENRDETMSISHEEAEFARLLGECQSRVYAYIHSLVRDVNDTDDLFQQTAMILWRKFGQFKVEGSFLRWACGIARYEVANFLRSRRRRKLYFSDQLNLLLLDAQDEVTAEEVEEQRGALAGCVDRLRQRDQELLRKCYLETDGVKKVAERGGRAPQSVYNSLRRIRRALYECVRRSLADRTNPEWTS